MGLTAGNLYRPRRIIPTRPPLVFSPRWRACGVLFTSSKAIQARFVPPFLRRGIFLPPSHLFVQDLLRRIFLFPVPHLFRRVSGSFPLFLSGPPTFDTVFLHLIYRWLAVREVFFSVGASCSWFLSTFFGLRPCSSHSRSDRLSRNRLSVISSLPTFPLHRHYSSLARFQNRRFTLSLLLPQNGTRCRLTPIVDSFAPSFDSRSLFFEWLDGQ